MTNKEALVALHKNITSTHQDRHNPNSSGTRYGLVFQEDTPLSQIWYPKVRYYVH